MPRPVLGGVRGISNGVWLVCVASLGLKIFMRSSEAQTILSFIILTFDNAVIQRKRLLSREKGRRHWCNAHVMDVEFQPVACHE